MSVYLDSAEFFTIDSATKYSQNLLWNHEFTQIYYIHDSDYITRKNICINCAHYDNGLNCYEDSTGSYSGIIGSMFLPIELRNPNFYCPLNKFSTISLIGGDDLDSA